MSWKCLHLLSGEENGVDDSSRWLGTCDKAGRRALPFLGRGQSPVCTCALCHPLTLGDKVSNDQASQLCCPSPRSPLLLPVADPEGPRSLTCCLVVHLQAFLRSLFLAMGAPVTASTSFTHLANSH